MFVTRGFLLGREIGRVSNASNTIGVALQGLFGADRGGRPRSSPEYT